ncbi:sensor domain-containing diguanylate cyclase [Paenibacillus filicis]|uniref:Sensor domain-containing diguanylate cyclase n=1 Tax=Paenibacillus gyeongsangnamensis TaxID=3388067 RepID=A0ABT4Q8V1_9BACL|nr:sensor domain-containing diguanylate cyclase [Paenibacillus filicis]MCZ8513304.1 sensor domain-containing diguanylate cyclase [Paenibacillus filicis]
MDKRIDPGSDSRLQAAVEHSPDGLLIIDPAGIPVYASPAIFGGRPAEQCLHERDRDRIVEALHRLRTCLEPFEAEFLAVLPDGREIWAEGRGYPVPLAGVPALAAFSVRDVTRRKEQELQLTRLAYYDVLTGLPNRRLFHDRFTQSLIAARRYQRKLAVLYLDLDDFKKINDCFGHSAGDELLVMAAARLTHSIREPDTVCRMGGDEFVVLLQHFEERDDIVKIARRIADALNQPFDLSGRQINFSTSIGAALFPEHGSDDTTLLNKADMAMYAAKRQGKNALMFYSES